jgi:hypothetical protein
MKIRQLVWKEVVGDDEAWWAQSPIAHGGDIYIRYEEGEYWPSWSVLDGPYDNLEEAQEHAQKAHEAWIIEKYMEQS